MENNSNTHLIQDKNPIKRQNAISKLKALYWRLQNRDTSKISRADSELEGIKQFFGADVLDVLGYLIKTQEMIKRESQIISPPVDIDQLGIMIDLSEKMSKGEITYEEYDQRIRELPSTSPYFTSYLQELRAQLTLSIAEDDKPELGYPRLVDEFSQEVKKRDLKKIDPLM